MEVYGALLDTRSIQKYIFAGNKLKTNIGASYLVEQIYERELVEVLNSEPFCFGIDGKAWKRSEGIAMETDAGLKCELAYVGGGNALVLFREAAMAKKAITELTKRLLVRTPGLRTGAALGKVVLGEGAVAYKASIDALYQQLKQNQNNIVPDVNIPYTGLTVECEISGDAACVYDTAFAKEGKKRYISAETMAKISASDKAAAKLQGMFGKITDAGYSFVGELEKLGQQEGDEYIAIVHIDGNDMGTKFSKSETLQKRKELSLEVAAASLNAFRKLLDNIVTKEYAYYEKKKLLAQKLFEKRYLPIRPIILGGDDITFVCPAKLGIIYAKRFMELLQEEMLHVAGERVPFSSCAGVAILPTKYPFFRGYELAEQLCGAAKEKSRPLPGSSWLEYAILHGEQAPTLEQIRAQEYKAAQGDLHFGPYRVAPIGEAGSIERLLTGAREMAAGLPQNKIKELRDVIRKGSNEIDLYLRQLEHLNMHLPIVEHKLDEYADNNLWSRGRTPYLDMIEVIDYMYDSEEASL